MSEVVPNPGSREARDRGCICPVMDNWRGSDEIGRIRGFIMVVGCPLHDERESPMTTLRVVSLEGEPKPPPVCEVCGEGMWWHGGTLGWGCPTNDDRVCRSVLHRPMGKRDGWSYRDRYPELDS